MGKGKSVEAHLEADGLAPVSTCILVMVCFMMVCFMLEDAQRAGKMLFQGVFVQMFPEEISIRNHRLSKEGHPHQCVWTPSNILRTEIQQKSRGRGDLFVLLELGPLSPPA